MEHRKEMKEHKKEEKRGKKRKINLLFSLIMIY